MFISDYFLLYREVDLNERYEASVNEQTNLTPGYLSDIIQMVVIYSATTEYTKYLCDLEGEINIQDTFIYQVSSRFLYKMQFIFKFLLIHLFFVKIVPSIFY